MSERELLPPAEYLQRFNERQHLAEDFSTSPAMKRARAKMLATTFRCSKRGCVLAYVYVTPCGVIVHQPRYKLSPEVNAASSNESGRANNTLDGDHKWKSKSHFLEKDNRYRFTCDHLIKWVPSAEIEKAATRRAKNIVIG